MNGRGRPDRILIVDHKPATIVLLERILCAARDVEICATTDPTQAECLCAEFAPDLIVLDLNMPGRDGLALMRGITRAIDSGDYVPILVLADETEDSKCAALQCGAKDFVAKPFDSTEVVARVGNLLDTRSLHLELTRQNAQLEQTLRDQTAELARAINRVEVAEQDRRLAHEETIHRLSLAADFRDDETSRHIERMSRYCAILAARVGRDERQSDLFRLAAKMHDIGKLGIPDAILRKPGRLIPEEFDVMKGHAEIGYRILEGSRSELARTGAMIAWTHHERVDGGGYPRGLTGDEIPLEGRIAAIADVFDALTTDRVYRHALPVDEAVRIMCHGRCTQFDAELLDLFLDSLDRLLITKDQLADVTVE